MKDKLKRWGKEWKDAKDWRNRPPTQKQLDLMEKLGCDWDWDEKPTTRKEASDLIDEMLREREEDFIECYGPEFWKD